jgi:hypothetical protein
MPHTDHSALPLLLVGVQWHVWAAAVPLKEVHHCPAGVSWPLLLLLLTRGDALEQLELTHQLRLNNSRGTTLEAAAAAAAGTVNGQKQDTTLAQPRKQ